MLFRSSSTNFTFTLVEGPTDLIQIVAETSKIAVLQIIQEIDREDEAIQDVNGILSFVLEVSDPAGNSVRAPVS